MEQQGLPVELGDHTYHLLPQRSAKILRRLLGKKGIFSSMQDFAGMADDSGDSGMEPLINAAGGKLYEVLLVFIPDLMPRHEFEGYGSQSAMEAEDYDETGDKSPTMPQIEEAFRTIIQINGLKWVKKLSAFFDPDILRAEGNAAVARFLAEARENTLESQTSGTTSRSLPQPNGGSAPTSSGTSEITPSPGSKPEVVGPPTTASHSPASSD